MKKMMAVIWLLNWFYVIVTSSRFTQSYGGPEEQEVGFTASHLAWLSWFQS